MPGHFLHIFGVILFLGSIIVTAVWDPLPLDALPPWESYAEEVVAVMDAVDSERAAIMGIFDAG